MVADERVLPAPEEPAGGGDVGEGQASAALWWWCDHQQFARGTGELVSEPDIHHPVEGLCSWEAGEASVSPELPLPCGTEESTYWKVCASQPNLF